MGYTKNEVEKILKTLPVGYYIKRGVNVSLSDTADTAYYDPMSDSITVSYPLIAKVLKDCADDKFAEENIRTLLYHEVSHAFLTPKNLKATNVMNIFEDERIESILRNFYMGVNFRDFIKRVNNYTGAPFKTADEAFYGLVRYRVGDEEWLNRLHSLITRYNRLNRNTESTSSYVCAVTDFYNDFVRNWKDPEEDMPEPSEPDDADNDEGEGDNSEYDSENENESEYESEIGSNTEDSDAEEESESSSGVEDDMPPAEPPTSEFQDDYDMGEMLSYEESIERVFITPNSELSKKVNSALSSIKDFSKRNGAAINAYSGVFDPRAVARDDCRYFVQKNRLGNAKAYSKTKLNLFIDRSGSFYYNTERVNQILKALADFEKINPDFTFDLVTMGVGDTLIDRHHREMACSGGNWLKKDIFDIFKKLQDKNSNVYNIVLFDGDAFTDVGWGHTITEESKNFKAFNFKNVSIISDPSNRRYIEPNCNSAHVVYTKNYTNELFDNIVAVLHKISR